MHRIRHEHDGERRRSRRRHSRHDDDSPGDVRHRPHGAAFVGDDHVHERDGNLLDVRGRPATGYPRGGGDEAYDESSDARDRPVTGFPRGGGDEGYDGARAGDGAKTRSGARGKSGRKKTRSRMTGQIFEGEPGFDMPGTWGGEEDETFGTGPRGRYGRPATGYPRGGGGEGYDDGRGGKGAKSKSGARGKSGGEKARTREPDENYPGEPGEPGFPMGPGWGTEDSDDSGFSVDDGWMGGEEGEHWGDGSMVSGEIRPVGRPKVPKRLGVRLVYPPEEEKDDGEGKDGNDEEREKDEKRRRRRSCKGGKSDGKKVRRRSTAGVPHTYMLSSVGSSWSEGGCRHGNGEVVDRSCPLHGLHRHGGPSSLADDGSVSRSSRWNNYYGAINADCPLHGHPKPKAATGGGDNVEGPVVVRIRSQRGGSGLVEIIPPTFAELERFVEEEYGIDNPHMLHETETGNMALLESEDDFRHAVGCTAKDRYMSVVLRHFEEGSGPACCCCGNPAPPPAGEEKSKKKSGKVPILRDAHDLPGGLGNWLLEPPPGREWYEWKAYDDEQKKRKQRKAVKPMLRAFI